MKIIIRSRKNIDEAKAKSGRNFLNHNVSIIIKTAESIMGNLTADALHDCGRKNFLTFLKENNISDILKQYQIKKLLDYGQVGFAFELEEPHENYILKIQMGETVHRDSSSGVSYPSSLKAKQEKGEYEPTEINVLESVTLKNVPITEKNNKIKRVHFALFVYSKVSMSVTAGTSGKTITAEEAFKDIEKTKAEDAFRGLYKFEQDPTNFANIKNLIKHAIKQVWEGATEEAIGREAERMITAFHSGGFEAAMGLFYKLAKSKIKHLSKQQYINICKEYYKLYSKAMREGTPLDFHGENFGFRPFSDTPMSFDV